MASDYVRLIMQMPLFRGITEAGAERLIEMGAVKEYPAGEHLCQEGDPAFVVILTMSGTLRAYIHRNGKELVMSDKSTSTKEIILAADNSASSKNVSGPCNTALPRCRRLAPIPIMTASATSTTIVG